MKTYKEFLNEIAFSLELGTPVMIETDKKTLYGKVSKKQKVLGEDGYEIKWSDGSTGRFRAGQFTSISGNRKAVYKVELDD